MTASLSSLSSPEEVPLTTSDRVFLAHDPHSQHLLINSIILHAEKPCECKVSWRQCSPCWYRERVISIKRLLDLGMA